MAKNKWSRYLALPMLSFVLVLAACSGDDASKEEGGEKKADGGQDLKNGGMYSIEDFNNVKANEGEAIDGGTVTFGLVSDTVFEGTLNWNFYSGAPDAEILEWFDEGLLTWDENYVYTNDGAATYEVSEDGRTFTFKIGDNVNWHDGKPVTAEDLQFAHEVIGSPDYDGPRYNTDFTNIEGMEEYNSGKADTISGIEVIDEKTLSITYIESTPSLLTGSIWTYPLAKHIFGDMAVADISSSPEVREKPIGFGPFKVDSIVPGESVTLTKNEDYWRGEPKLDGVTIKVIGTSTVVQELESGGVDLVSDFPVDQFPDNAEMSNVEYLGAIDRAYTYIGFKQGTWNAEKNRVAYDPEAKMGDVELRQAMWHAVDNTAVGEKFYNGLRWNATTLIPPSHPEFHDQNNKGREYDPEVAKQLLEDAGYVDTDDDGFREDPEGNPLEINFVSMTGGDTAEPLAQYYVQSWEAVGLNVNLEMVEFNSFYDRIGNGGEDDPSVDVYQAAWGVGIDVDPSGLYGADTLYNFSRWENAENDRLLAEGRSEKAFDLAYRQEVYNEWQQLMVDEVPVFPTLYRALLAPVNNRVMNYAIGDGTEVYLSDLAVNAESPVVAE